ncbi:M48 family metalloprotease [Candidatus Roizmanbacteria bacterium]|jgi:heat shock protein HtpX|nr:M48 family metalloprotease [Candidatus Roizmanbacteria bacterium]
MTIYSQISANKRRSYLIVVLFIILVTGFFYLIGKFFDSPNTYLFFGLAFSFASSFGSYFYSDKVVLWTTGAVPADKEKYFDFYTVADNLAIGSGLPKPALYVIDDPSPNAFATGRDPKHAVVCATTGLLEKLGRSELEGVVAHELSHIKNYDILLSSLVAVLVGTVSLVSDWLMRNLWWGGLKDDGNDRDNRNPLLFIFFVLVLIITPLVSTIIQLAISRKREFLADASGALLTRYPEGLARALEKINADQNILQTASTSTAHLFISNPFKRNENKGGWLLSLFSTHPPVEERIRMLRNM